MKNYAYIEGIEQKNKATNSNSRYIVRLGYSNNSRFATPTTKMGLETCF